MKYNTRANQPRIKGGHALLQSCVEYINKKAKEWGLTKNAALERIVVEHQAQNGPEVYDKVMDAETKRKAWRKAVDELRKMVEDDAS